MPERPSYHRPAHIGTAAEHARRYDRARQSDKNFYSSSRWLDLRALKLSCNPLCEECERLGRITLARHVHHREPRKTRPDLALDLNNLEALCIPCHNAKPVR